MLITRRVEFSASHVCSQPSLGPEENRRLYGAAANPRGHGHNYVLEVTLEGEPDPVTGMIFDLKKLKEIIQETVVEPMDHRFLNYEVPPFDRTVPTAENVAMEIWNRLSPRINGGRARVHNVRLYETEDLYVDYAGESS
jgi:6-pyruvoyltetrahydropterin/6-carboxytetrahydropterin synthase